MEYNFDYINSYYGLNIKRGTIASYKGKRGKVVGTSSAHVKFKIDGEKHALPYHPSDLEYEPETKTEKVKS